LSSDVIIIINTSGSNTLTAKIQTKRHRSDEISKENIDTNLKVVAFQIYPLTMMNIA